MKIILSDYNAQLPTEGKEEYFKHMGWECHWYDHNYKKVDRPGEENSFNNEYYVSNVDLGEVTDWEEICNKRFHFFHLYPLYQKELDLRTDSKLVELVEKYGDGTYLRVVEIPDGVDWYIDSDEGTECVAENHRRWG